MHHLNHDDILLPDFDKVISTVIRIQIRMTGRRGYWKGN